MVTLVLSLAPMPFLSDRYQLLPPAVIVAMAAVFVVLTIAAACASSTAASRAILAAPVLLALALDPFGVIALIHVATAAGSSLRGGPLLLSAIQAWLANVAGFALVYWYLDEIVPHTERQALLFPEPEGDRPHNILDYLYVAVTTALAFGPTDTPPADTLTRFAMLLEALISFVIVALVAARAINAIG